MDDMAEKNPVAQVKIGHYLLGDTLGVGTFGKVKSKCPNVLLSCGRLILIVFFT